MQPERDKLATDAAAERLRRHKAGDETAYNPTGRASHEAIMGRIWKDEGTLAGDWLAARADERQGWRPIATAPKDDTRILLYGEWVFIGAWDMQYKLWFDESGCTTEPTHWLPLPSPPALSIPLAEGSV